MMGKIFDIQRCSLHDGPGIRTTVFLKGCSLRCQWCSNPESFRLEPVLGHLAKRCISCLACTKVCDSGALHEEAGRLKVEHSLCVACGRCVDECPEDALKLYGREASPEEILEEVLRDRAFFERSGGGLTLSGGEVLLQAGFAAEILREAREAGLHTCIETSGYGRREDLELLLPHVDLFLYDYKATGEELHRALVGGRQEGILANLAFLAQRDAVIHLRCPIVPGLNDREEHFRAIAALKARYDSIRTVELLPYHNYGEHKYAQLGLSAGRTAWPAPSAGQVEDWKKRI